MATRTRKKPTAISVPEWAATASGLMDRWCKASAVHNRYSIVFRGDGQLQLGDRLERLLAVAFCRQISHLMTDPRSVAAVDVAEQFADGNATQDELSAAKEQVWAAAADAAARAAVTAADAAAAAAHAAAAAAHAHAAADAAVTAADAARNGTWLAQGKLLIGVVGPEWVFSPSWQTATAGAMACHIYESRDFGQMPILADAIQDAGCEESVLLASLRDHESLWCRGCRILDELLGKRGGHAS